MEEYHKHTQTHTLSDKQLSCLYFVIHKTLEFVKISMFRKCLDVIISNCCATKCNGTFELARNVGVEKNHTSPLLSMFWQTVLSYSSNNSLCAAVWLGCNFLSPYFYYGVLTLAYLTIRCLPPNSLLWKKTLQEV
jgi:hypothetical protein